ncbi:hypothetical protein GCM10023080_039890 [Streptomyces pseudoechinosporeus]
MRVPGNNRECPHVLPLQASRSIGFSGPVQAVSRGLRRESPKKVARQVGNGLDQEALPVFYDGPEGVSALPTPEGLPDPPSREGATSRNG